MPKANVDKLSESKQELKSIVEKYNRGIVETDYEKTESGKQFEKTVREAINKIELAEEIYESNDTLSKPPNVDAVCDTVYEYLLNMGDINTTSDISETDIKNALETMGYKTDSPLGKAVVKELR